MFKSERNHCDFNEVDNNDYISDDEVFTNDLKHSFDDENCVTKPLMARRKHPPSKHFHTQVRRLPLCRAFCVPCIYSCIAFSSIVGIACLIIFLVKSFNTNLQLFHMKSGYHPEVLVGCSHLEVEDVWIKSFPKLLTESAIRLNDVNEDGVLDILIGFATGADGYNVPLFVCDIYFNGVKPCFGGVLALDGKSGSELWRCYSDHEIFALNCNEDLDLDGVKDCLAGGRAGTFQAISGKTGSILWKFESKEVKNDVMNVYTAQFLSDINEDGIVDVLATHGGDALAEPGSKYRLSGKILILSGKDGKIIQWVGVPDQQECYYSPQILVHPDGTELVIFGTGGETHPGSLWYIMLNDILKGNVLKAHIIMKDSHKGVMAPPVLADITGDNVEDIIISFFNSTVYAFDGLNFNQLWNFTIPSSETYSTPAPGYYNNDDVLDFLIKYQVGPGFPIYFYSKTTILDGATGKPLLKPVVDTVGAQASGLTISMEGTGNDLFLYWTSNCIGHEGESQEFTFVKGTNVHEQSRSDFCKIKFNSRLVSRLHAVGQNFKSPGIAVYDSERRKSIEYDNFVNTSAMAVEYIKSHPDVWHMFHQAGNIQSAFKNENPKNFKTMLTRPHKPKYPQETEQEVQYRQHHNIRKHGRDKSATWNTNYFDVDDNYYENQNLGNLDSPKDSKQNLDPDYYQPYDDDAYGNAYEKERLRNLYLNKKYENLQLKDNILQNSNRRFVKYKRHVGPHDGDGIQRLISTGTLVPPLNTNNSIPTDSIDIVIGTYWFFPAKTQAILPEDRDCIQKLMAREQQRFSSSSTYYGLDHDAYESKVTEECLKQSGRTPSGNHTYESQSDYDPFNIHMGQMTVYRLRLRCTCNFFDDKNKRCARVLPFKQQGWTGYLGTHANGHFIPRRG